MTALATMQRPTTTHSAKRNEEESGNAEETMRWGHLPLAGESSANG